MSRPSSSAAAAELAQATQPVAQGRLRLRKAAPDYRIDSDGEHSSESDLLPVPKKATARKASKKPKDETESESEGLSIDEEDEPEPEPEPSSDDEPTARTKKRRGVGGASVQQRVPATNENPTKRRATLNNQIRTAKTQSLLNGKR